MYPYNYNIPQNRKNMYRAYGSGNYINPNMSDDRFIAGGFIAPLLLGGVAGYAIGQNNNNNNRPMYYYPQPYYYYPANFSNNYYYSPYYY